MNKNMKIFYTLSAVVLFISLSLTGCDNIFRPPVAAKTKDGKGLVLFQFGSSGSRTAMPDPNDLLFSDYRLTLTPIDGNGGSQSGASLPPYTKEDLDLTGGEVTLLQGWWRVESVFYAEFTPSVPTKIADGVIQDFQVGSSTNDVIIELKFLVGAAIGTGILEYEIESTVTKTPIVAVMSFSVLGGGSPLASITPTLNSQVPLTTDPDAGYYLVTVTLTAGTEEAVKAQIVHIYPGQMTLLKFEFDDTNFHSTATDPGTPFTVTFNRNLPSWVPGNDDPPATVTVTPPAKLAPPTPAYPAGWGAGMEFKGWYLDDDTTEVTEDTDSSVDAYARWSFTAGTLQPDGVVTAPEPTQAGGGGHGEWNAGNTKNTDGSFTLVDTGSNYNGGGIAYQFPDGIADYDFVELEYVLYTETSLGLTTKVLSTGGDAIPTANGQYLSSTDASGSRVWVIKSVGYSDGISLSRGTGGPGTVKLVKATFTKGTRHTISFTSEDYDDWVQPAPIQALEDYAILTALPNPPARTGYSFTGWFNALDEQVTEATKMGEANLELTAGWLAGTLPPRDIDDPVFTGGPTPDGDGFREFTSGGLITFELPANVNNLYKNITVYYTIKETDLGTAVAQDDKLIFKPSATGTGDWGGISGENAYRDVEDGDGTWTRTLPLATFNYLNIQDNTDAGVSFKIKFTKIEFSND